MYPVKAVINNTVKQKPARRSGGYNNNKTATHSERITDQAMKPAHDPINDEELRTVVNFSIFSSLLTAVYVNRKINTAAMMLMVLSADFFIDSI
jgi:hypothetical protein